MARKTAAKKGKFLLQKAGRRKNTQKGNARKGKSFVTTASKKKGVVQHVYNINGKRVVVDVKKKGAKAGKGGGGGRTYKRAPKGSAAGGQFSK